MQDLTPDFVVVTYTCPVSQRQHVVKDPSVGGYGWEGEYESGLVVRFYIYECEGCGKGHDLLLHDGYTS